MRFSFSGFFHGSVSPGPLSISLGPFKILMNIHEDITNFVFIAGVVVTDDKLSLVSLTLMIKSCPRFSLVS